MTATADAHILNVIQNLLESTSDLNENVINAVKSSLYKLSEKYSNDILNIAYDYNIKTKLQQHQVIQLLEIIAYIAAEHTKDIDGDVVLNLIDFSIQEMIKANAIVHNEQEQRASDVLVALGKHHCIQVMEGLMKNVISGAIPHYMIIHTIGSLALTNCYGTVPYVKSLLTKMLPITTILKFDHHKQAFAYAMGSISFAVTEYLANIQKAPDPTLSNETFYSEFTIAYDILAISWLPSSRDTKVLECILQALSSLILVIPTDKLAEQIPRIIPQLLSMYKRIEPIFITKCICSILSATAPKNRNLLELQLDDLVHHLVEHITMEQPDYAQLESLKNHSEILRCFDCLFSYFPFKMIDNLSQHLKNNNDVTKLKSLIVVCHMMNTSEESLKAQLKAFIPILKHLLNDTNFKLKNSDINWSDSMGGLIANRSKKVMLKIIVLLTYHRFIDTDNDDLSLFLHYIVKLCCLQWSDEKLDDTENLERLEFKRVCDNSMYLLTTSSTNLESQLWSLYLDCFVNMEYKAAACSIVRCLSYLANKFKENPEELTANIKTTAIFVRSLSLLATPLNNYQGTYVLNFLRNFAPFIDNKIILLWDKRVAEILKFLEYTSDNFNPNEWESIILRFLTDTIIQISDEKWTMDLIDKFEQQILQYLSYTQEKGFTLLCLASSLSKVTNLSVIDTRLDSMLCLTRSDNFDEIYICSKMIKFCAKIHLKCVLKKLQVLSKNLDTRKTKFFGLLKDSRADLNEKIKLTVLMCYAEIATIDCPNITVMLIEFEVLSYTVFELRNNKEQIRAIALKAIKNIIETFHQNRNMISKCFDSRDEILFTILELLYENSSLASSILDAATSLVKLSPQLNQEKKTKVFKLCFENIYSTKIIDPNTNEKLLILIKEILLQQITPSILEEIFCLLQMWMIERDGKQRLIALNMFKSVLSSYLEHLRFDTSTQFELTGFIIGCLIPRLNDPIIDIRIETIHSINLILKIASKYEGGAFDCDDLNTDSIITIIENIQNSSEEDVSKLAICDYARIISSKMSHFQLMNFTESMLNGLMDVEISSAYGVTFVLDSFIKVKGGDMFHYVEDMIFKIISIVEKINYADVKLAALKSISTLASHHPKAVITALLIQPLGYDTCVPECWRILTEDQVLASAALSHFIRLISGSAVYDEQVSRDRMRIAMHQPLAAISAISDMFCWAQMEELAIAQFPEIFCILYISLASYIGVSAPIAVPQTSSHNKERDKFGMIPNRNAYKLNPTKLAVEAFKTFLLSANCVAIAENLVCATNKFENVDNINAFINIVPKLIYSICSTMYHVVPKLLTNLSNYRSSSYEPQRIAVYAFYCEYVNQRAHIDVILLESTVSGLLEGQADSSSIVRQLSLRGLGYLANHNESLISRHSSSVLNAFMNGLDEHKIGGCTTTPADTTNIPLESLKGLYNILSTLDEEQFDAIQINTGIRIKPFFESDDPQLRAAAIQLFGKLVALSKISLRQNALREQVNNNLICFLLHLSDTNNHVVKACNSALRNVVPVLNTKKFNALIQDHLIDEAKLNYNTFMPALIKTMAIEIPETFSYLLMSSLTYLKSKCPVIRGNTAFVIGLLCSNLPSSTDTTTTTNKKSLETVSNRLITLLKDNDANVRAKTAYALSYL